MELTEWIQLIALLVAIIVLIITIINFNNQIKLNFFADYTKRYQEIMLHLPEDIDINYNSFSELPNEVKRYLRAYIDLCSEEYYLHQYKKIEHKIWVNWEQGIKAAFKIKVFKDAWVCFDKESYPDFYRWMTTEIIN